MTTYNVVVSKASNFNGSQRSQLIFVFTAFSIILFMLYVTLEYCQCFSNIRFANLFACQC
jgi:hypothetical protein